MKKVILLIRVSTEKQNYEDQTNELRAFVKNDGYTEEEMLIIQNKESATKLADEERQGLKQMWAAIDDKNNCIEAVYCWELSRLSRKPETLYKIKKNFIDNENNENRKINLITLKENFRLFDANNNLLPTSSQMFAIWIGMIESDSYYRKERTTRAKIALAQQGKYTGGYKKFGYKVNPETKIYEIDEKESETVRLIFNLYETGRYGHNSLRNELQKRGQKIGKRLLQEVLHSEVYTGKKRTATKTTHKKKTEEKEYSHNVYERQYPAIISQELYDKCQEISKLNTTNIDKSRTVYFASKLILCPLCNRHLSPHRQSLAYLCRHKDDTKTAVACSNKNYISINAIDTALWEVAKTIELYDILYKNNDKITDYKNKITDLRTKIDACEQRYDNIFNDKLKKLKKEFKTFSEDELKKFAERECAEDKTLIYNEKMQFTSDIKSYENLLNNMKTFDMYNANTEINEIKNDIENKSDKEKYELIHTHIKEVRIEHDENKTVHIQVIPFYDQYVSQSFADIMTENFTDENYDEIYNRYGENVYRYITETLPDTQKELSDRYPLQNTFFTYSKKKLKLKVYIDYPEPSAEYKDIQIIRRITKS